MKAKSNQPAGAATLDKYPTRAQTPPGVSTETWKKPHPRFQIRKILAPVDFSEASGKAVQYALAMAGEFGAEVILIHVIEPYPILPELPAAAVEMQAALETQAKSQMRHLESRITDVQCRSIVCVGNPARRIAAEASSQQADLIVLSTHGRTGFAHALLGSVAEHVVRIAPCPVLVVREREREFVEVEVDNAQLNRVANPKA